MSGSSEPVSGAVPAPVPTTLVVDFGTATLRAAVVSGGASWLVPEPVTGLLGWPAAAHWDGAQLRVGTLATRARSVDPDGYWSELPRVLTLDASVAQRGRTFRPIELATAVLQAVLEEAQQRHGTAIERALLTVPAIHPPSGRHRDRLIAAAEAAGIETVELLAEPVAAIYATDLPAGARVLVCDLGAGSFDLSLVRVAAEPQVLATDSLVGAGRELDALVEQRIYADGQEWLAPLIAEARQEPGGPAVVRLGMALTDFAQRLKHRLSEAPVAEDAMLPRTPPYRLTREDLAEVVAPMLARAVARTERLLHTCGLAAADLDALLLTGGGARMPVVGQRLARGFGRSPFRLAEPELIVVHGAVRWLLRRGLPVVAPEPLPPGTAPLAFAIPGGRAQLVRWLVAPGQWYDSGAVLARVRLPAGGLWDLTAAVPGTLQQVLAAPESEVSAHQWLALATP